MENKLFDLFKLVLLAHIETKTVEPLFHSKSEEFYTLLFDCFHQISEKKQDIEENSAADCRTAIQTTYDNLEQAKVLIDDMIQETQTIGMDNLLRGLYDKLESACGNAKAFIKEEKEEAKEKLKTQNKIPS